MAYLPVILVAFGCAWLLFRRPLLKSSRFWLSVLAGGMLCAGITAPHYILQYHTIQSGEAIQTVSHTNSVINLPTSLSVLVRNLALQEATPFPAANATIEHAAEYLSNVLGISVNDPNSTFLPDTCHFQVQYRPKAFDEATGFFHFLFLMATPFLMGWVLWKIHQDALKKSTQEALQNSPDAQRMQGLGAELTLKRTGLEGSSRIAQSLFILWTLLPLGMLFSFSALFRWQIYHSRLLIPCVAFAAVSYGLLIHYLRWRTLAVIYSLCLLLWLIPTFPCAQYTWYAVQNHWISMMHPSLHRPASKKHLMDPADQIHFSAHLHPFAQSTLLQRLVIHPNPQISYLQFYLVLKSFQKPHNTWPLFLTEEEAHPNSADAWLEYNLLPDPAHPEITSYPPPPPAQWGWDLAVQEGGFQLWVRPEIKASVGQAIGP